MKKLTAALLALLLTLALASGAQAGPGGGPAALFGAGPGPAAMLEHMADHLDLDDIQRESVRNILEAAKPEIEALGEQARANREALHALDTSDPAYTATLNDIATSNGQLATEGTLLFTRIRAEVDAVLTDEQREKLARSKERMRKSFGRRWQRG